MTVSTPAAAVAAPRPGAGPASSVIAVQFVLVGVIWGSSFLFMKVALEGISPAQVAWGRLVLGALTLVVAFCRNAAGAGKWRT